jgi:hypothetical protein
MTVPNETLMAYVDGELDPSATAEVERALRADPELAARAARYRDLRTRLESAYASELAEPVPERLLAALRTPPRTVVTVQEARAARQAAPAGRRNGRWTGMRWTGVRLTSIAAGVLLALGAGLLVWRDSQSVMIRAADGALVASGALARGLSDQLSGDSMSSSKVTTGLSFLAKSGDYCRTFSIAHGAEGEGLACRRNDLWRIAVLAQPASGAAGNGSQYRTASSGLPPAVLSAVQDRISGDPLDRAAEIAARARGWRGDH